MSDPASVIVHTVSLLAVAVVAGAVGSLRGRVEATRDLVLALHQRLDAFRGEQERDRARVAGLREAVRRIDEHAPELDEEPGAESRIGFRPPDQR